MFQPPASKLKILPFLLLFFSFACVGYVSAAPTAMLYLDELGSVNSDYTVYDSQNNYDGTVKHSPSIGSGLGKICSGIDLRASSTSDYIVLDKNSLSGAGDFTISIWHKGDQADSRSLLSGARAGRDNELLFWLTNGNNFHGYIDGSSGSGISIPSIIDNKWHHLVWRRAGDQSCVFTDGVKRGCVTQKTKILNIESLILGQEQDNVGGAFDSNQDLEAIVDELLIFKSGLSDAEIKSIYDNQKANKSWDGQVRSCPVPPLDNNYSDWHFDEASYNGTANEIVDSHSTYHGTAHSVSTVPGKICNGIDLRANSATDYATLGEGAFDGVDDFTVSVWHKGSSSSSRALLSAANSPADNEALFWFSNSTVFNGHLKDAPLNGITTNNISDGNWHHFAWVRRGTQSCFYLDSVSKGCQTKNTSQRLSITKLILGQDQDSVGGGFDVNQDWEAIVDELLIFRRAFSASQISSIYNNQNAGKNWDGGTRTCPHPAMSLKKISVVISDPVNNTNNPKRIPGAIVRYTITAKNASDIYAENIVIKDDLSTQIQTLGNIAWNGNLTVDSPNINNGNLTALTDAAGDDEGEFINNKVEVRCGNINNTAPCIVTYDVEIMH